MKKNFFTIHSNFSSSVEEGFFKNFPIEFYSDKSKYYSPMNDSLIREMYIILLYKQHRLMDKFPRDEQGYITIVFSANELSKYKKYFLPISKPDFCTLFSQDFESTFLY